MTDRVGKVEIFKVKRTTIRVDEEALIVSVDGIRRFEERFKLTSTEVIERVEEKDCGLGSLRGVYDEVKEYKKPDLHRLASIDINEKTSESSYMEHGKNCTPLNRLQGKRRLYYNIDEELIKRSKRMTLGKSTVLEETCRMENFISNSEEGHSFHTEKISSQFVEKIKKFSSHSDCTSNQETKLNVSQFNESDSTTTDFNKIKENSNDGKKSAVFVDIWDVSPRITSTGNIKYDQHRWRGGNEETKITKEDCLEKRKQAARDERRRYLDSVKTNPLLMQKYAFHLIAQRNKERNANQK
ncbi:hypothetical protein ACOME3_003459 [Neoechinorhynchus agilis]